MNIDNKFPLFRSFLADPKLNLGQSKTSLGHAAVTSTEQKSVNLDLLLAEEKKLLKKDSKDEKKKKKDTNEKTKTNNNSGPSVNDKNSEQKQILKLLNLI